MKKTLVPCVLAVMLSACQTTFHFKDVPLDRIEVGSTTESDIRDMFGVPNSQTLHDSLSGTETLVYNHLKVTKMGSGRKLTGYTGDISQPERRLYKTLEVWFDEEGVVTDYNLEQRSERAPVR